MRGRDFTMLSCRVPSSAMGVDYIMRTWSLVQNLTWLTRTNSLVVNFKVIAGILQITADSAGGGDGENIFVPFIVPCNHKEVVRSSRVQQKGGYSSDDEPIHARAN